jgi:hypothetical protein
MTTLEEVRRQFFARLDDAAGERFAQNGLRRYEEARRLMYLGCNTAGVNSLVVDQLVLEGRMRFAAKSGIERGWEARFGDECA